MKPTTTIRSWGALGLGIFFAGITTITIFDDVWHGAPVTIAHMNALGALVAAIASGHFLVPTLRQKRPVAALGLAMIFLGATAYVVTSSGARNAEVASVKASEILKANEERAGILAKLAEAEADVEQAKAEYDEAKRLAAKECASGKGKRCDGRVETRDAAAKDLERSESHAALQRGKLAYLGPETVPFAGYKRIATLFAAFWGDAATIEARLIVVMPFASVLITELCVIVFLALAIGHASLPKADKKPDTVAGTDATEQAMIDFRRALFERLPDRDGPTVADIVAASRLPENDPEPPKPRKRSRPQLAIDNDRTFASHPAIEALTKNGGSVASNRELAEIMGVCDGEATKRRAEVRHMLIEERVGKECRIRLRA